MGCIEFGNGNFICGNFAKITRRKPKNWIENGYKIIIPYKFKWRVKIGCVECDCKVCEEHFQPWYGFSWYHSKDCSILKHIEKHPGIQNLNQYYGKDLSLIAMSD